MQLTQQDILRHSGKTVVTNPSGTSYTYYHVSNDSGVIFKLRMANCLVTFGHLDRDSGDIIRHDPLELTSPRVEVLRWVLNVLWREASFPSGYTVEFTPRRVRT